MTRSAASRCSSSSACTAAEQELFMKRERLCTWRPSKRSGARGVLEELDVLERPGDAAPAPRGRHAGDV